MYNRKDIPWISLDHTKMVADEILSCFHTPCVVAFYGKMGAGKTTLIKAICDQLNVIDTVTSPTFSIINEYRDEGGDAIFHVDFYRVEHEGELYDLGLEEYFDKKAYCFIEWPEKAKHLLPDDSKIVTIESDEKGRRKVIVEF